MSTAMAAHSRDGWVEIEAGAWRVASRTNREALRGELGVVPAAIARSAGLTVTVVTIAANTVTCFRIGSGPGYRSPVSARNPAFEMRPRLGLPVAAIATAQLVAIDHG